MPKDISIPAQANAALETALYTEIYNIELPDDTLLRVAPYVPAVSGTTVAFTFGGEDYLSFEIRRSPVQSTKETEVRGIVVQIQNVDQQAGALIGNNDVRGGLVTISGVFLASGTNTPISDSVDDLIPIFDGVISAVQVSEEHVKFGLQLPIQDIKVDAPRRFYSQGDGFDFLPPIG